MYNINNKYIENDLDSNINKKEYIIDNDNSVHSHETNHLYTRSEIKTIFHKIFLNISTYNEKDNCYYINQKDINKIINNIYKEDINKNFIKINGEIDILFKKLNPNSNKLNEQQFFSFMIKIPQKIYPDFKNEKILTINNFLSLFFDYYYNCYNSNNNINKNLDLNLPYKSIEIISEYKPNIEQLELIKEIFSTLKEIYIKYFSNELNEKNIITSQKSLQNLIIFSKDFEIIPFLITQSQLGSYYNLICVDNSNKNKIPEILKKSVNIGINFTLNHFILMIIQLSILSYFKNIDENDNNEFEEENDIKQKEKHEGIKLLLFLETLNNSKGMRNGFSQKKFFLIPEKKKIYQIFEMKNELIETKNNQKIDNDNIDFNTLYSELSIDKKSLILIRQMIYNNLDNLFKTYSYYSSNLDNKLKINGYLKFLKNCDLIINNQKQENNIFEKSKSKDKNLNEFSNIENELNNSTKKILLVINNNNKNNEKKDIKLIINQLENTKIENKNNKPILTSKKNKTPKKININNHYQISESQANVIFSKFSYLTHSMNFVSFINSFPDIIDNLLNLNIRESNFLDFGKLFKNILSQNIIPNLINTDLNQNCLNSNFENNIGIIEFAYLKLQNDLNIKNFLKNFSNVLDTYYKFYCEKNDNSIIFIQFKKFFEDFWIFPDFINQLQLKNLFYFLSNKSEYLPFNKFIETFGIIALINDFEEIFDNIDKLIFIIEKMNQSNGIKKCILKSGRAIIKGKKLDDFCEYLKNKYPNFYNKKKCMPKNYEDVSLSFSEIYGKSSIK